MSDCTLCSLYLLGSVFSNIRGSSGDIHVILDFQASNSIQFITTSVVDNFVYVVYTWTYILLVLETCMLRNKNVVY
jgi:hypothetical protein